MNNIDSLIEEFKTLVQPIPARQHPWFKGIIEHRFTHEQIIAGERQHYLRNRLNALAQSAIVMQATIENDDELIAAAVENFREEVGGKKTHGDLMYQFLQTHEISKSQAAITEPMPGTMAGISMIIHGLQYLPTALERFAVWSLAEWENGGENGVASAVYDAYTDHYEFLAYAAETYKVHALSDVAHGESQLRLLAKKVIERPEMKDRVVAAMKFGHAGFNFEWDGHYQAATGNRHIHWQGI